MSRDRKDISAYKGTMKMMRTMYLCKAQPAYLSSLRSCASVSIQIVWECLTWNTGRV